MGKVSINLLPQEVTAQDIQKLKQRKIARILVVIVMFMLTLSAGIVIYGISKKSQQQDVLNNISQAEQKIVSMDEQENSLTQLKNRLASINSISSQESKAVNAFYLFVSLIPSSLNITSMGIDRFNNVSVTGTTNSTFGLKTFLDNLTIAPDTKDKISKVNVESLSKVGSGIIRFDLTTTLK